jgi:hypothetical protein
MRAPVRLALFGLVLAALFAASWGVASALAPPPALELGASAPSTGEESSSAAHDDHDDAAADAVADAPLDDAISGVSMSSNGMHLAEVAAPTEPHAEGTLAFSIVDGSGHPVTDYVESHEQLLHLIVVRTDGSHFRHVHPTLEGGTWSMPWAWQAAGSYRLYADFTDAAGNRPTTLTTTIHVGGEIVPARATGESRTTTVDGMTVTVEGELAAGEARSLTLRVERDGEPVTTLEPYLGAFGHLVVLREGDLAYLHAHPEGDHPDPGQRSGPEVGFSVTAPTAGRYFLYLDFQVDGTVHTAQLALEAVAR